MTLRKYRADDPCRPVQFSKLTAFDEPLDYVIHEHWATRHHFDLRLQVGKVLLSWVLTSPPSLNPSCSTFAIAVFDHPRRCLNGEGRIPEGSYGAGPMIMWDRGVYRPVAAPDMSHEFAILEGMRCGRLELMLHGVKMRGGWVLRRHAERWIFGKLDDEFASSDQQFSPRSVLSGRLITDL